jgi:flagellar motor switch protein FliN/FliY
MGNGLSQNEIDALLAGVDEVSLTSNASEANTIGKDGGYDDPNKMKKEVEDINDFLSKSLNSGLSILSKITESKLVLSNLKSTLKDSDKILNNMRGRVVIVSQVVKGALNGEIFFIFDEKNALKIIEKMLGQEETVLSEIALSTLGENFNQYLSSMYLWIKNSYKQNVEGETPRIKILDNAINMEFSSNQAVEINYTMKMDDEDIPVIMVLPVTLSKEIINISMRSSGDTSYSDDSGYQNKEKSGEKQINARPVQFSRLDQYNNNSPLGNIEILLDVTMQVTVELGRTKMRIREILGLGEGSIIELQKLAGEPVDILVNGKLIAKGEVVVIDEYFGVRITEIISPSDMINLMSIKDE